jgi:hypothetical protein
LCIGFIGFVARTTGLYFALARDSEAITHAEARQLLCLLLGWARLTSYASAFRENRSIRSAVGREVWRSLDCCGFACAVFNIFPAVFWWVYVSNLKLQENRVLKLARRTSFRGSSLIREIIILCRRRSAGLQYWMAQKAATLRLAEPE